jgi:hypothetical protein
MLSFFVQATSVEFLTNGRKFDIQSTKITCIAHYCVSTSGGNSIFAYCLWAFVTNVSASVLPDDTGLKVTGRMGDVIAAVFCWSWFHTYDLS